MRIALAVALLVACKERGTATIDVHIGSDAEPCVDTAATVIIYAAANQSCASCTCSSCFMGTIVGCGGHACTIEEFRGDALDLDLPAGKAALFYDFFDSGGNLVASACVDIALDRDGTSDVTYQASAQCCAAQLRNDAAQ